MTRTFPAALWRDLRHAGRSLARARAFTVVCVVSLGIGMAPVIAIPYVSRLTTLTPAGVTSPARPSPSSWRSSPASVPHAAPPRWRRWWRCGRCRWRALVYETTSEVVSPPL
jgi:hypothetical protein